MLRLIDLRGRALTASELRAQLPRPETDAGTVAEAVASLIADVRTRGEAALRDQARRFDGSAPIRLRVARDEIAVAVENLDPEVRAALEEAIARVRLASAVQVPPAVRTRIADGGTIEQRWQPVDRVGLYVPGGKAVYPSSVVMNVVPAQTAGVASIAIASPPQREFGGAVHPTILGAAGLLGIEEVWAMGGAGAIAALAYGVPSLDLEAVDLITGPGNIYVATAKRLVHGAVGIDAEAGPTEILIIADDSADARLLAADLISQAEHDELAAAVLVTASHPLAVRVNTEVEAQLAVTKHRDRALRALSGTQSAILLVDDQSAAVAVSNAYGPEHLEIQTVDPDAVLSQITNAGAIFLGSASPVSLGDYLAGSNHVLPTGGQARFSAGLGAAAFLRSQQVIRYDLAALSAVSGHVHALAEAEDLPAHAAAVAARFISSTRDGS